MAAALASLSLLPMSVEDDADATVGVAGDRDTADAAGGALVAAAAPALDEVADTEEDEATVELSDGGVQSDGETWWYADEPEAPEPLPWTARATITNYCLHGTMRSGRYTYVGAVATDHAYIPEGSLLEIEGLSGWYRAEDTGSGVRGWWVDMFRPSCDDARRWGRQQLAIRVIRWGY